MMRLHVLLLAAAIGCDAEPEPGSGDTEPAGESDDGDEADTDASDDGEAESSGDESGGEAIACDDEPVITYDTFGRGFLAAYCNGCHGAEVADRKGAPASVVFDDRELVSAFAERILVRVDPLDEVMPPMPPNGGPTRDDLERARIWLTCYP